MKSKEARMMSWRLKLKLAAVVFLGAAALLLTPGQPALASTTCPSRHCLSGATILGCCSNLMDIGIDSKGYCSVLDFCCLRACR